MYTVFANHLALFQCHIMFLYFEQNFLKKTTNNFIAVSNWNE